MNLKMTPDPEAESLSEVDNVSTEDRDVAFLVLSSRGRPNLQLNGYNYRKAYKTRNGTRWVCSKEKNCQAFLYVNDKDEVTMSREIHDHPKNIEKLQHEKEESDSAAVVITSRKGKEMLLFRHFTYRKQYIGSDRVRWACSTEKNCRACVFTNSDNFILTSFEEHSHSPPKYYLKPDHVFDAIREPIILETD